MKGIFIQLFATILVTYSPPLKYSFQNNDIHLNYGIETLDSLLILDIQCINKSKSALYMYIFNESNIVVINDYESNKLCIVHSYQDIHQVTFPLLKLNSNDTLTFNTVITSKYIKSINQIEFKIDYLNPNRFSYKDRKKLIEKLILPYPFEPYYSQGYFTIDKYDYYVNCDRLKITIPF